MLAKLGYPQLNPNILQKDNMSTIHIIINDCNTQTTKHIDIRYNLVREQVQKKNLAMIHLFSNDMTSDMLTKALSLTPFLHLRRKLLGMYSYLRLITILDFII